MKPLIIPDHHDIGACMDKRHIAWIYEMLSILKPRRTLEVGVHTGCSSVAFINVPDPHFADITRTAQAMSVLRNFKNYTFHRSRGCDVIRDQMPFDVVLLDGAHDIDSVYEEWYALQLGKIPRVLIGHDFNATSVGFPHCYGSEALYEWAKKAGMKVMYDREARHGERTDRGLFMACEPDDEEAIRAISEAHDNTCAK